jgi:hypothetical protein
VLAHHRSPESTGSVDGCGPAPGGRRVPRAPGRVAEWPGVRPCRWRC